MRLTVHIFNITDLFISIGQSNAGSDLGFLARWVRRKVTSKLIYVMGILLLLRILLVKMY